MKNHYTLLLTGAFLTALSAGIPAWAQTNVSGTVSDADNQEPLAGVNVIVKGTSTGTVTDIDGNYRLSVEEVPAELTFSFIGYLSQTIPVSSADNNLNVSLSEDMTSLEEVVVTGLASSVKRSNLANAVSSISSEELTGVTEPQTVDNALYGKMPGVNITANDGAPGGGVSVQLRGISTLGAGSSQPLYIVDGVYVNNSSLRNGRTQVSGASDGASAATQDNASNRIADLNPDDIESIEVLKGPSAAAIYGTRANAGVIIITTKKGQAGETRINLQQDIGFASALNLQHFDTWNPDKITTYFGNADQIEAELQQYNEALNQNAIVDWEEELYGEKPLLTSTQLSVSGGSEKTQFYVSGRLQSENGIIKNTGFDRYSIRANVDHALSKAIDLNVSANYLRTSSERGFTGNQNNTGGSLGYNIAYTPTYANLKPDAQGNYPINPYFNDNPYAIRDLATNTSLVNRFITSFSLDVNIFQTENSFLKFNSTGGVDFLSAVSQIYFPEVLQHQQAEANPGDVVWGNQNALNTNIQGFFVYNTNVGRINLNTQVGGVRLDQDAESVLNRGRGLSAGQNNLQWATVQSVLDQELQTITDVGWVAQEEINWDDKIIGTLGIRFDRSTLNATQSKYYAFPKASLAVNVANFDFWKVNGFSQLKARAAYGETGGLPSFGNTFESLTSQQIGGSLGAQVSTRAVDPSLRPETASEIEVGLDAGFLDNTLLLEATYYVKTVNNLILDQQPAESTGITAIATNAGDLKNTGIELGISASPVRSTNFEWFTRLLYWRNKTEIIRLDIPTYTTGGFGPALGTYLIAEGYSPTTIVGTPADETVLGGFSVLGNRQPDFQTSFFNQITFLKSFEFTFLWHWSEGGSNINLSALLWDEGGSTPGWSDLTTDADGNSVPFGRQRITDWSENNNASVYVQDASFIKLREAGLYYSLPSSLSERWFDGVVNRIKVGISGNNLLLFTKYESYDPEVSNFGVQSVTSSIEVTPYPTSRRMMFHVAIDF